MVTLSAERQWSLIEDGDRSCFGCRVAGIAKCAEKHGLTRVLLLTRYARLGASSRIRHHDLVPGLSRHGFVFTHHALLDDAYLTRFYGGERTLVKPLLRSYVQRMRLLLGQGSTDLIWIEKEAFPWLPWTIEKWAFSNGQPAIVVDFDDFWPSRYSESRWPPVRAIGRSKFRQALARADAVTVANAELGDMLSSAYPGFVPQIVHNGIDIAAYRDAARAALRRSGPETFGPMKVGWIGTPFTAAMYLGEIAETLNQLTAEGTISLTLIGAGEAVETLRANRVAWSEATEMHRVAELDVGLMPLNGSTFDAGKSGWKLVQFMAAGKPVVAAPIGFNRTIVSDGINGFHAASPAEFEIALRRLAADPDLRSNMGRMAEATTAELFSRDEAVRRTATVFETALCRRRSRTNVP